MSDPNHQLDKEHAGTEGTKANYDEFKAFYASESGLENADLYKHFPNNPESTLRKWKMKLLSEPTNGSPKEQKAKNGEQPNAYLVELVKNLKARSNINPSIIEELDLESQYHVLKKEAETHKADPNMKIFTPGSSGQKKLGIDKYMTIDEKSFREKGWGNVELVIPASKLFNPEENKKLREFQ